jgi:hypothetical protein
VERQREPSTVAVVAPRGVLLVLGGHWFGSSVGGVGPLWCGCGVGSCNTTCYG